VAASVEAFNTTSTDLLWLLLLGLASVILVMAALAWIVTGRALASVTRITENAESLGARDLASGLPVPSRDAELTRLVVALNRMLARLHESHTAELAFAADAGHRLRTPVATLRAEAELALRETDPVLLTAALQRVVTDADQLTGVVDRMLARSRSQHREPAPVRQVLADAGVRWQRQASVAGVRLAVTVDDDISADVCCIELDELLEPVLDNAVRHTPGEGLIDVDVHLEARAGNHLVIRISNTGEPIDPELAPRVFDAWVSSRDATVAGGLGLWLARETARDLGGDMALVPAGPHATTVEIRLPCDRAPAEPVAQSSMT
jgi:signal transduction histidine kinase